MVKMLSFVKEPTGRWFVDLPDWKGDKDDLEMVMGADTMLDYMCEGEPMVVLILSTEKVECSKLRSPKYELNFKGEIYDGATYLLSGMNLEMEVWLCHVTKHVFGNFPHIIYVY